MSTDATSDDRAVIATIEEMRRDVATWPPIYRPGAFWNGLIEANLEMLRNHGVRKPQTHRLEQLLQLVSHAARCAAQGAMLNWLRRPSRTPVQVKMERPCGLRALDRDGVHELSRGDALRYRFFVAMAWERARREDQFGLRERLSEPEVDNPIRIRLGTHLISQDLANSIIECSFAGRSGCVSDGARVAELGAGYGRLAYVFTNARELTYCIFDIPPALAVAQWYLTQVLGPEKVVAYRRPQDFPAIEAKLRPGVVAFFSPDRMELFPDGWFDLTQTISTLPEMPQQQSNHFLSLMAAKASKALFLKQWLRWRNDADGVELAEENYHLPHPWRLTERRVDPIQPAFFNQLWRR